MPLLPGRAVGYNSCFVLFIVASICSAVSYFAVHRLGIYSTYSLSQRYGPRNEKAVTILHGSSLAYSGIDWERISALIGGPIQSWATAGSSPAEWEIQQHRSPELSRLFVVVSAYDLNEDWLCDFRADIVPLAQTMRDLRRSPNWPFAKRVLSQYAVMMLLRKAFPTVGRSDGVMTGIRDTLEKLVHGSNTGQATEGTKFGAEADSQAEKNSLIGHQPGFNGAWF